jgi:hypothetical protein
VARDVRQLQLAERLGQDGVTGRHGAPTPGSSRPTTSPTPRALAAGGRCSSSDRVVHSGPCDSDNRP